MASRSAQRSRCPGIMNYDNCESNEALKAGKVGILQWGSLRGRGGGTSASSTFTLKTSTFSVGQCEDRVCASREDKCSRVTRQSASVVVAIHIGFLSPFVLRRI